MSELKFVQVGILLNPLQIWHSKLDAWTLHAKQLPCLPEEKKKQRPFSCPLSPSIYVGFSHMHAVNPISWLPPLCSNWPICSAACILLVAVVYATSSAYHHYSIQYIGHKYIHPGMPLIGIFSHAETETRPAEFVPLLFQLFSLVFCTCFLNC